MNRSKKKNNTQKKGKSSSDPVSGKTIDKGFPGTKKKEARKQGEQSPFNRFKDRATLGYSIVAIFISLLALFNSQKQTELAEQSMKFSNRPYVIVQIPKYSYDSGNFNELNTLDVTIKNIGQTPSYKIEIFAKQRIEEVDSITVIDYKDTKQVFQIAFLDNNEGGESFTITDSIQILNEKDIKRIKSKEISTFIYGYIIYEDIFKDTHRTEFCFLYNSGLELYGFYKKHNEAY